MLAVEAMEGTNRTIERVRDLQITGSVVVKTAKPQQDLRFDLPVIGEQTLDYAREAGCTVVGVEAKKSLIMNREKVTRKADEHDMTLVGI